MAKAAVVSNKPCRPDPGRFQSSAKMIKQPSTQMPTKHGKKKPPPSQDIHAEVRSMLLLESYWVVRSDWLYRGLR